MRKKLVKLDDQIRLSLIEKLQLGISVSELAQVTQSQYSSNSMVAIVKDWDIFIEYCIINELPNLPSTEIVLRRFIEYQAKRKKYSTIKRYVTTIGLIHRIVGLEDPTKSRIVKFDLSQLRVDKKGDMTQPDAMTKKHLDVLETKLVSSTKVRSIRNLAMYFLMYECAIKRGELKTLKVTDVCVGNKTLAIGQNVYPLSDRAMKALSLWMNKLPDSGEVLFRAINKYERIGKAELDDSSIYRALRSASDLVGDGSKFSGQSARIGVAKEMKEQGVKIREIQHFGRWQSPVMPLQYTGRKEESEVAKIAHLSKE